MIVVAAVVSANQIILNNMKRAVETAHGPEAVKFMLETVDDFEGHVRACHDCEDALEST